MTETPSINALTSAIECVQKAVRSGDRGSVIIDNENVRPFDELDSEFGMYSALRED